MTRGTHIHLCWLLVFVTIGSAFAGYDGVWTKLSATSCLIVTAGLFFREEEP